MPEDAAEAMSTRLRADLKTAMREKRSDEMRVLRALLGAIDNAQAVPVAGGHQPYVPRAFGDGSAEVPRLRLSVEGVQALLSHEAETRDAAAAEMDRLGQSARGDMLRAEAAVVRRYLAG